MPGGMVPPIRRTPVWQLDELSLDLAPSNWAIGLWVDAPPVLQLWPGPLGLGITRADPGDGRSWDCAWTLGRITVGRTEFRLDADLNIHQIGVSFARGWRDFGVYLGPLNLQAEYDICWHDPRPNPLPRLLVPKDAPKWSILTRRERTVALEAFLTEYADLVRLASADTGLDRPIWIGRGMDLVVMPCHPGDQAAIDRDCVAVGLDQDTGYRDADRWLGVNAYLLRKVSAGLTDRKDFLSLPWRLQGAGFVRAR